MSNAHLAQPDAELAAILANLPRHPPPGDIYARRELFESAGLPVIQGHFKASLPDESKYEVKNYKVAVDNGEILVRCTIPSHNDSETFPALLWMHAGGYVLGTIEQDDYLLRRLTVDFQLVTVNVEYRLAPEFPFPTGLSDSYAALKWVANNPESLPISLKKGFIIGGCSAGGNFSASLAIRARDDPLFADKPLTGQLLQIPQVLHPEAFPDGMDLFSREQNKDSPLLSREEELEFAGLTQAPAWDPSFSVLLASSHAGLPPAYIQVCGADMLRDEGLLYEKTLREAGVKTKLDVYPGLPHGGHLLLSFASLAKKFNKDFDDGLKWLLEASSA